MTTRNNDLPDIGVRERCRHSGQPVLLFSSQSVPVRLILLADPVIMKIELIYTAMQCSSTGISLDYYNYMVMVVMVMVERDSE